MAYLRRLIHRAAVYRPTVARTETGVRQATLAAVSGMGEVHCLLIQGQQRRMLETFGADIQADAMVYFARGTDIRPNVSSTDGKSDRLTITVAAGGAALGMWSVVATHNPGGADRVTVAAVKRVV